MRERRQREGCDRMRGIEGAREGGMEQSERVSALLLKPLLSGRRATHALPWLPPPQGPRSRIGVCVCIYICVYIYIYVCIYIYKERYVYTHTINMCYIMLYDAILCYSICYYITLYYIGSLDRGARRLGMARHGAA